MSHKEKITSTTGYKSEYILLASRRHHFLRHSSDKERAHKVFLVAGITCFGFCSPFLPRLFGRTRKNEGKTLSKE